MANYLAQAILSLAQDEEPASELARLWLTAPLNGAKKYDAVIFSGGVGEYVYGKETKSFGDLGAPLGRALHHQISNGALHCALAPARECIRATVMGAAQHTVQVSGNTIYRTDENLLPQKNLQVLRPDVDLSGEIDSAAIAEAIQKHFRVFDLVEGQAQVALVFRWDGPPMAIRIAAFCRGLIDGLPETLKNGQPIYVVFDHDLARIGRHHSPRRFRGR